MSHTIRADIAYPRIRGRRQDLRVLDEIELAYSMSDSDFGVPDLNEHIIRRPALRAEDDDWDDDIVTLIAQPTKNNGTVAIEEMSTALVAEIILLPAPFHIRLQLIRIAANLAAILWLIKTIGQR